VQGPEWKKPEAGAAAINSELIGQLTVLASQRNTHVLDAEPRIPWLLWCGLIFGGVLLVGLTGFMRLDSTRAHIVLSGAVAVLLGLLLFAVYGLDHSFGSQVGITPAPFEHSLEVFDAVDSGK
jgi:drug/metabolite transporter (DMT)-like permease